MTKLAVRQRLCRASASATPATSGTRIGASPINDPTYDASVQKLVRSPSSHSGKRASARAIVSLSKRILVTKRPSVIMNVASRSMAGWATIQDTASEGRRRRRGASRSEGPPGRGLIRRDARESSGTPETFRGRVMRQVTHAAPIACVPRRQVCQRAAPAECRSRKLPRRRAGARQVSTVSLRVPEVEYPLQTGLHSESDFMSERETCSISAC